MNKIKRKASEICLTILEKYDSRDTIAKVIVYKVTRKIFDKLFWSLNNYSPYDYVRNGETEEV